MFETVHQIELALMVKLQAIRSPLLDQIMIFFNLFDTSTFYFLLLTVVWYGLSQRFGVRLLYVLVLNVFVIQDLKELLAEPRPCQLQPTLALLSAKSHGFPSGAAAEMLAAFGYLALEIRRSWFWVVGALFVLLVSFSRVYLGLHFPSDILGGWLFGLLVLIAFWKSLPRVEEYLTKRSSPFKTAVAILSFSGLFILSLNESAEKSLLFGLGASLGLIWAPAYSDPAGIMQRILRPSLAVAGFFILQIINPPLLHFLSGIWLGFGVPLLIYR